MRPRRQRARPADIGNDVFEYGLDLLRRELEGDGPAWRPRHHAQPLLLVEAIDLHDHAVVLVWQIVAFVMPLAKEADHAVDIEPLGPIGVYRETKGGEPSQRLRLAADGRPPIRAFLNELVRPRRQPSSGCHARIQLSQRARPAVARIGVSCLLY